MFKYFMAVFIILATPIVASAECDFNTSLFQDELEQPSSILEIDIRHHEYRDWLVNALRIIVATSGIIDQSFKDRFDASVTVKYPFGECDFSARVRQSGDGLDHIRFDLGGQVVQSLDVELMDGHVMSATRFKLLIPETRNGMNEVLGVAVTRSFGVVVPETFFVSTRVNSVLRDYIFQEVVAKELLERNGRREGPIFEGDERRLWASLENFFQSEETALVRLVNDNWASRSDVASRIALRGYGELLPGYQNHGAILSSDNNAQYTSTMSGCAQEEFVLYEILMLAMNGDHALRPHNRQYYYNAILNKIEPIYYDGNLNFEPIYINEVTILNALGMVDHSVLVAVSNAIQAHLADVENISNILEYFNERVPTNFKFDNYKLSETLEILFENIERLRTVLAASSSIDISNINCVLHDKEILSNNYLKRVLNNPDRSLISALVVDNELELNFDYMNDLEAVYYNMNENIIFSNEDLISLISDNEFNGFETSIYQYFEESDEIDEVDFLGGIIRTSEVEGITLDSEQKLLKIEHSVPESWTLILNADLRGWDVLFVSPNPSSDAESIPRDARFNEFGLTACLTFSDSMFDDTSIYASGGGCEDTVNIINSTGRIKSLEINSSYQDALDIDVSNISIDNVNIVSAGNDCVDISWGVYHFSTLVLESCGDKAVSVGEDSEAFIGQVLIKDSSIGVAAKDDSRILIEYFRGDNIETCVAVYRKKQEFFGAHATVLLSHCIGAYEVDQYSTLIVQ